MTMCNIQSEKWQIKEWCLIHFVISVLNNSKRAYVELSQYINNMPYIYAYAICYLSRIYPGRGT